MKGLHGTLRFLARLPIQLAVVLCVLAALELSAYAMLRLTDPSLANLTANRFHPWLHGQVKWSVTRTMHPLWGWGTPSVRYDPSADYHLVMLGGSTVWGGLTPNRSPIPGRLETLLNRKLAGKFQVINAGQAGWTSANERAFLLHRVLPFHPPDAVVIMDGSNDVAPALQRELLHRGFSGYPPANRDRGPRHPIDPQLRRSRQQLRSFRRDPVLVGNHLMHVILESVGLVHYLEIDRYFLGVLVDRWLGLPSPSSRHRHAVRTLWKRHRLPPDKRREVHRRTRRHPTLHRLLHDPSLEDWKRRARETLIAAQTERTWADLTGSLRAESPFRIKTMIHQRIPEPHYSMIEHDLLPCRRDPVHLAGYLDNVKVMLASAREHGVPVLHVLQPSIVYKNHLTRQEQNRFMWHVNERLFSRTRYEFPLGTCWHDVTRRFFDGVRFGLAAMPFAAEPTMKSVDLSRLFAENTKQRFTDFVHYSAAADSEIARRIAETLSEMDWWDTKNHAGRKLAAQRPTRTPSEP